MQTREDIRPYLVNSTWFNIWILIIMFKVTFTTRIPHPKWTVYAMSMGFIGMLFSLISIPKLSKALLEFTGDPIFLILANMIVIGLLFAHAGMFCIHVLSLAVVYYYPNFLALRNHEVLRIVLIKFARPIADKKDTEAVSSDDECCVCRCNVARLDLRPWACAMAHSNSPCLECIERIFNTSFMPKCPICRALPK
jgi:hypothetical protein